MSTVSPIQPTSTPAQERDPYRFGPGPQLRLMPGTHGWSASDLEDPEVYYLFQEGRFEILDGVLVEMPPAHFDGDEGADNLKYLLRDFCRTQKIPYRSSAEVDIKVDEKHFLRADGVCVFGEDLVRMQQHAIRHGQKSWGKAAIMIGPSLVIESVSEGHEAHDRETKRRWYAELGAKRYWIVDVFARSLECLVLDGSAFCEEAAGRNEEVVTVPSLPGLSLPLKEVWGS